MSDDQAASDVGPPTVDGDERETLVAFLDYLRGRVVAKLNGINIETARTVQTPTGTTLYWLGTHMSAVEINQFQRTLAGRDSNELVPPPPPPAEADQTRDVIDRYERACAASREILDTFDNLNEFGRGVDRRTGTPRTVRWVLAHMIEETARHLGHLDVLREHADGATGR